MKLVALTGGIGSGKSTVRQRFAELGAIVFDADQFARDAVAPGTVGLERLVGVFGRDILEESGALDRARLGARVFGDADLIARLNAVVHPEVRRLAAERIAAAIDQAPDAVIVYEIPLLAETAMPGIAGVGDWDLVIVADTPAEQRIQRLEELRGMAPQEARRRVASQASDAERLAYADERIDTSGTLEETVRQVDEVWSRMLNG